MVRGLTVSIRMRNGLERDNFASLLKPTPPLADLLRRDTESGEVIAVVKAWVWVVSKKLLGSDLLPKDLLPASPKQPEEGESAA